MRSSARSGLGTLRRVSVLVQGSVWRYNNLISLMFQPKAVPGSGLRAHQRLRGEGRLSLSKVPFFNIRVDGAVVRWCYGHGKL